MKKIFVIDTETGGVDPRKFSILSFAGAVWHDGKIIDTIDILINEPREKVEPEAMMINGIDLASHKKNGVPPIEAIYLLEEFLDKNFGEDSITICGHNVHFDVGFLQRLYRVSRRKFPARFSRRYIDTASILGFLSIANIVKIDKTSLDNALSFFNIPYKKDHRHTALGDVFLTCELLNKMLKTITPKY